MPTSSPVADVAAVGRPLDGRTVVVTRATDQASALVTELSDLGADVLAVPVIAIEDASDGGLALERAAARAAEYDWVVVTSTNGVERLVSAAGGPGALATSGAGFAAVGRGTAGALESHGLDVGVVPDRFVAEGLLAVFPSPPERGGRILLAQAQGARPVLREGLAAAGWQVDVVEAYRTVHPPVHDDVVARARIADAITFTSASTVRGFVDAAGPAALPDVVVTIGPVTSAEAARLAVPVTAEADPHSIAGLVAAVVDALGGAT